MARIPTSFFPVVVAIFLTVSHAVRVPANVPVGEVKVGGLPSSDPVSADGNAIIRLPSYSNSEYSQSAHSVEPHKESSKESDGSSNTVQYFPMTMETFRPVDHSFRLRSRLPFRCRYNHRVFIPLKQHRGIPYGDDMILPNGEAVGSNPDQRMFQSRLRHFYPGLVRLRPHNHHGGQKLDGDAFPQLMFKSSIALDDDKYDLHNEQPHLRHHHHYRIHEDVEEEERKEKHDDGFMKSIRKILDRF